MEKFLQQNWFKIGLLFLLVVFVSVAFYWYEWRPLKIRHDCSWVHKFRYPREDDDYGWWEPASEKGYDLCVRGKGLLR